MMPLTSLVLLRDGTTNPEVPIPTVLDESGCAEAGLCLNHQSHFLHFLVALTHATTTPRVVLTNGTKISV